MPFSKPFSYSVLIFFLFFAATGYWLVNRHAVPLKVELPLTTKPADVTQTGAASQSGVRFYLELDPSNPAAWEDNNGEIRAFESCNSLGVNENLARDFPELLPDFVFIGDQIVDREQFLQDQNFTFANPEHFHKTWVAGRRNVNGETGFYWRIQCVVAIGNDGLNPAIGLGRAVNGMLPEVYLSEIWRIAADGGAPQLLERIVEGEHDGFYWHHEDLLTTTEHPPRPISTTLGGP